MFHSDTIPQRRKNAIFIEKIKNSPGGLAEAVFYVKNIKLTPIIIRFSVRFPPPWIRPIPRFCQPRNLRGIVKRNSNPLDNGNQVAKIGFFIA